MGVSVINLLIIFPILVLNDYNLNEGSELSGRIWHPNAVPFEGTNKWPVYYELDDNLPPFHQKVIKSAIDYINWLGCKTWVNFNDQKDLSRNAWRIRFTYVEDTEGNPNCTSTFRSRIVPRQTIVLGKWCFLIEKYQDIIRKTFSNPNFEMPEHPDIPEDLHLLDTFPSHKEDPLDAEKLEWDFLKSTWLHRPPQPRLLITGLLDDERINPICKYSVWQDDFSIHARVGKWCWLWARFIVAKSTVLHHMMRSMGFRHEHQRPDRDCFVNVDQAVWETKDYREQATYQRLDYVHNGYVNHQLPYDYHSITHYNNYLSPKDSSIKKPFGRYSGDLSKYDIHNIQQLYCGEPDYCSVKEGYGNVIDWKPECKAMWKLKNETKCHWW